MKYDSTIHKRRSIRLQEYDYSQEGLYFVTICVNEHLCLFGQIKEDKMCLSVIGVIADVLWYEIKNHAINVELHNFVVMPNHIHGIIEIMANTVDGNDVDNENGNVGARHALPLQTQQSRFQNQGKNTLSSIVGSYKSAVTKHAHRLGFAEFAWQRNYFEHIIRNTKDCNNIVEYITNNPVNWKQDKFYMT